MWLGAAIALNSVLALRWGVHALILRGLRAPRLAHLRTPADIQSHDPRSGLPSWTGINIS
jgi:hypothetical protein